MTPAQLSALAAFCGVTPESDKKLFPKRHLCPKCSKPMSMFTSDDNWCPKCKIYEPDKSVATYNGPDPTASDADPREVDGVYLSGLLWSFHKTGCVSFIPQSTGRWLCELALWGSSNTYEAFGESHTLALLRAAQAAGVAEVVNIMEDKS